MKPTAITVKTNQERDSLLAQLHQLGLKWRSGRSLLGEEYKIDAPLYLVFEENGLAQGGGAPGNHYESRAYADLTFKQLATFAPPKLPKILGHDVTRDGDILVIGCGRFGGIVQNNARALLATVECVDGENKKHTLRAASFEIDGMPMERAILEAIL